MRYIDTSSIVVPPNWVALAKATLGNNHASLWSYFKGAIEGLVGKKCWFSESINSAADNDIEHFRPKGNNVRELTAKYADLDNLIWQQIDANSRGGYGFLRLEFSNYRYVCTFVNSPRRGANQKVRGKSNFFPLQLNSPFANSINSINNEVLCLLDPCVRADCEKLTFNDIGEIDPHISILKHSWDYCRVVVSIEVYHLHYYRFTESRKQIWDECKNYIELANELQLKNQQTELDLKLLKFQIGVLNKRLSIESEYSAVAIDCVRHYKKQYDWLERVFPSNNIEK